MIRILTDSASDILPAEAAQLGVDVIPLNVTLEDGTVIRDGVDLTPSEYYEHMAGCKKLPTTSQPSPELFEKFYAEAAAAGDEVVGIFLSHELSGTYQCAKLAADLANVDNVLFVDSTNVCLGEGLLVRLAAEDTALFRFLLEGYDNTAYFTVLEPRTALLKLVFSPHREEALRRALAEMAESLDFSVEPWPLDRA